MKEFVFPVCETIKLESMDVICTSCSDPAEGLCDD